MSNTNRFSSTSSPNGDVIKEIQAVLELEEDTAVATIPVATWKGENRIGNPVSNSKPRPTFHDRFGQPFGGGEDVQKSRSFTECETLLAREMLKEFPELLEFRFDSDPTRNTEQLLRLHQNIDKQFDAHFHKCHSWFNDLVRASFRLKINVSRVSRREYVKNEATSDADRGSKSKVTILGIPDRPLHFKPKQPPFSRETFAQITPQEQLAHVRAYWSDACLLHSRGILSGVAGGVDHGPFERPDDSQFGIILYDELHRKATYNYLTREVVRDEKTKVKSEILKPPSHVPGRTGLRRVTTTFSVSGARQLVHHSHSIVNVQRLSFVDALNAPWLQTPQAIEQAMRSAPHFLRPFLDVFAGELAIEFTVVRDLERTESVSTEHRDITLPCEPALTLFRNFVLAGWNPGDMEDELHRRSQVRVRQFRQSQIETEKEQADRRHKEELEELHVEQVQPLTAVAVSVGILLLLAMRHLFVNGFVIGSMATAGLALLFLLVPVPYHLYFNSIKREVRNKHRSALQRLDAEQQRLDNELSSLNSTPLSES